MRILTAILLFCRVVLVPTIHLAVKTWPRDSNWKVGEKTGHAPLDGKNMIIEVADSVVTVATSNPAPSTVSVGTDIGDASLIVGSGRSLNAIGAIAVGANGTLESEGASTASRGRVRTGEDLFQIERGCSGRGGV